MIERRKSPGGRASTPEAKELRKVKKDLRTLSDVVNAFLASLDEEMQKPYSDQRGRRIAALANGLNLQNDIVRRFTLGLGGSK